MFWGLMEEQHYPGATQIKDHFEQLAEAQRQAAMNPPPAPVDPPTAPTAAVPEYAPTPGTNGIPGVYY